MTKWSEKKSWHDGLFIAVFVTGMFPPLALAYAFLTIKFHDLPSVPRVLRLICDGDIVACLALSGAYLYLRRGAAKSWALYVAFGFFILYASALLLLAISFVMILF